MVFTDIACHGTSNETDFSTTKHHFTLSVWILMSSSRSNQASERPTGVMVERTAPTRNANGRTHTENKVSTSNTIPLKHGGQEQMVKACKKEACFSFGRQDRIEQNSPDGRKWSTKTEPTDQARTGIDEAGQVWTIWLVNCSATATSNRRLPATPLVAAWSQLSGTWSKHTAATHWTNLEVGSNTRQKENGDASGRDCENTSPDNDMPMLLNKRPPVDNKLINRTSQTPCLHVLLSMSIKSEAKLGWQMTERGTSKECAMAELVACE